MQLAGIAVQDLGAPQAPAGAAGVAVSVRWGGGAGQGRRQPRHRRSLADVTGPAELAGVWQGQRGAGA